MAATFNRFAVPYGCRASHNLGNRPVLVSNLDSSHSSFSSSPSSFQDICTSSSYWILRICANNNGLPADGCKSIDMCTQLNFNNVSFRKDLIRLRI